MLTIDKLSPGREAYFLATVSFGEEKPGLVEPDPYWLGEAAALRFGLDGPASGPVEIRRVMARRDPATGEPLCERAAQVAAIDLCWSTPKSISVLHALADVPVAAEVRAAHDEAVAAALGYLEREAAAVRIRSESSPAGGFVACAFPHRISRAGDPHLHTHVLVANLAWAEQDGPDAGWRALDARQIFVERRTAAALYETHLRHALTRRLGVSWPELGGAWADIDGFDREKVERYSRRAREISEAAAAEGLTGPEAARIVAANTRPPKRLDRPYEELVEEWFERSYALGISKQGLERLAPGTGHGRPAIDDDWESALLAQLADRSTGASFTRREALVARCRAAPDGVSVDGAERDVDALLADDRVVVLPAARRTEGRVPGLAGRTEQAFTTRAAHERDERLAALVAERPDDVTVVAYDAAGRLAAFDDLARAARTLASRGELVVGLAPGRRAVASFEAASGIQAVAGSELPSRRVPGESPPTVVVTDAHRLRPDDLERLVVGVVEQSSRLVLVAPRRGVEAYPALAAIETNAAGRLPLGIEPPSSMQPRHHTFAGCEVTLVGAAEHAHEEALRQAAALAGSGRSVVLVAGDHASVRHFEASCQERPELVTATVAHARALDRSLGAEEGEQPAIVCLGGAAVLQRGTERLAALDRHHVVPVPAGVDLGAPGDRLALGLAAEAARPRNLVAALGVPPHEREARDRWRDRAADLTLGHERRHGRERSLERTPPSLGLER